MPDLFCWQVPDLILISSPCVPSRAGRLLFVVESERSVLKKQPEPTMLLFIPETRLDVHTAVLGVIPT